LQLISFKAHYILQGSVATHLMGRLMIT